ncbi:hypothetical protein [Scytonema hofmannii]|nr:hypothetical protein [Scytonema hofmannii]
MIILGDRTSKNRMRSPFQFRQIPEFFSQQYLLLIGGASLMATIEQSANGATFAQSALSVLIDANIEN